MKQYTNIRRGTGILSRSPDSGQTSEAQLHNSGPFFSTTYWRGTGRQRSAQEWYKAQTRKSEGFYPATWHCQG